MRSRSTRVASRTETGPFIRTHLSYVDDRLPLRDRVGEHAGSRPYRPEFSRGASHGPAAGRTARRSGAVRAGVERTAGRPTPARRTGQPAVQVGFSPVPLPVPWKPNSVDCPGATRPL
ncbi:hypothetical protein GCM10009779_36530 [Polymorphospora rubra]